LHHFLIESPWQTSAFRQQCLRLILQSSGEREIVLVIDDTGDRKKGQHPDYVKRQYVGNLGKIENGIVAVTA
jgi:SRSO17 transposase